jgi:diguanylate cyclase (GGDEF)-like protein
MSTGPSRTFQAYVGTVIALGAVVAVLAAVWFDPAVPLENLTLVAVFGGLLVIGELRELKVLRRTEGGSLTSTWVFAYALLLVSDVPTAVLGVGIASAAADAWRRKEAIKVGFNAAQIMISFGLGAWILKASQTADILVGGDGSMLLFVAVFIAAGAVSFSLNSILIGTVLALASNAPPQAVLRNEIGMTAFVNDFMLFMLAPVFVLVAEFSLLLLPLMLLTVTAVYQSARSALERERQALHDPLTGLPNRRHFDQRAAELLGTAQRQGRSVGVIILDLDRFKQINDTLGHHIGDLLLQQVGIRLNSIPEADTVARLGGDEFALLLGHNVTRESAARVAGEITRMNREPMVVEGFPLELEASMGIALYPDHGANVSELMRAADTAMYQAKRRQSGIGFAQSDRTGALRHGRHILLTEMESAMRRGELTVHYQPKVSISSGQVVGVEALIRWHHPIHGPINPEEFIGMVEQTELIEPLTIHVISQALTACRLWRDQGYDLTVAVNISSRSLQDMRFAQTVAAFLRQHELPASALELEITENAFVTDAERPLTVLRDLRALGLQIMIDDFGTGYSTLARLRTLPIQTIKIDKTFVLGMVDGLSDSLIVHSIIDLARSLSMRIVAEGVASLEAWQRLEELGCDEAQGFLIGPAMPIDELIGWLAAHTSNGSRPVWGPAGSSPSVAHAG